MTPVFDKESRMRHLLSTSTSIVAMLVLIAPIGWFLVRPALVLSISTAMASDIEETIDEKLTPITGAFTAILQSNVDRLRREISSMEFRRTNEPDEWTQTDAADLTNRRIDLDGQIEALEAMEL